MSTPPIKNGESWLPLAIMFTGFMVAMVAIGALVAGVLLGVALTSAP